MLLTEDEIKSALPQLNNWKLLDDCIEKKKTEYKNAGPNEKSFYETQTR